MGLVEKLRLYALDLHMYGGFNKYSQAMSESADRIERLEKALEDSITSSTLYSNLWKEISNE